MFLLVYEEGDLVLVENLASADFDEYQADYLTHIVDLETMKEFDGDRWTSIERESPREDQRPWPDHMMHPIRKHRQGRIAETILKDEPGD